MTDPTTVHPAAAPDRTVVEVTEIRDRLRTVADRFHVHDPMRAELLLAAAVLGRLCDLPVRADAEPVEVAV